MFTRKWIIGWPTLPRTTLARNIYPRTILAPKDIIHTHTITVTLRITLTFNFTLIFDLTVTFALPRNSARKCRARKCRVTELSHKSEQLSVKIKWIFIGLKNKIEWDVSTIIKLITSGISVPQKYELPIFKQDFTLYFCQYN